MIEDLDLYRNTKEPQIIAEIGSNWKGTTSAQDLANAIECCNLAAEYGATAVKFQMFTHREMYGKDGDDTFALPREFIPRLADKASDLGLEFLCSAFSLDGFKFVNEYVRVHKVASSTVSDPEIEKFLFHTKKPVLVSGGMFNVDPSQGMTIPLLCASSYPAVPADYDFFKMFEYAARNQHGWGLSDHTEGTIMAVIARAHGANYFEKHVNPLDIRDSPDYKVAMRIATFGLYTDEIRKTVVGRPIKTQEAARVKWGDRWDKNLNGYFRPS